MRFPLTILAACLSLPASAYAQANLTCTGPTPSGNLYNTAAVCSGITTVQNIFTGLVCNFQILLNAIMGSVYCGLSSALDQPLRAALAIFVAIYGIQLATGYVQASARELVIRVVKLMLVYLFATQSSYGIGIAYNFFVSTANEGIGWVLSVIPIPATGLGGACTPPASNPAAGQQGIAFAYMDYMICSVITIPFTTTGGMLLGFFSVMAFMIPPVFMMFFYFFSKSLKIFIRALFSYLLAISAIAFLITISPIFVSLALFNPTRHFFDDWLRFMISFTLQIILIFAGVAMWVTVILQFVGFFMDLTTMIRPLAQTDVAIDPRFPMNTYGLCQYGLVWICPDGSPAPCASGLDPIPVLQCIDAPCGGGGNQPVIYCPAPIKPSQIIEHQDFMYFLVLNMLAVCTVAYVFDSLMTMMPGLAKHLSGPAYAPQLGSKAGIGHVNMNNIFSMGGSGSKNFADRMKELMEKRAGPK